MKPLTTAEIWQNLQPRIEYLISQRVRATTVSGTTGGGVSVSAHALDGAMHTGTLTNSQAPQFLLTDGSRPLTGNLSVDSGIMVDGVDISAHVANPDAHHARAHSLISTSDHTASGLAVGNVLQATGATTFAWAQLQHGDLGGVTSDQHHAKLHSMLDTAHHSYSGGAALDVFGLSAASTLAKLTPSSNPGAAAAILRTDSSGYLSLVRLTMSDRLRSPLIDTVSGDLTLSPAGVVKLADGKTIQSDNFASGFTGNGWRIAEASSVTDAEFDNLSVRGLMRVYELLIHKIRTGNGSYLFANGGKVSSVSGGPTYTLSFDEDHGLAANDLLLAQKFTGSGTYQSRLTVLTTPTTKTLTATVYSGVAPAAGYEYVRIGNSSDVNRRGSVYVTADDSGAPFLDVLDGVAAHTDWYSASKIKARLGKLDGMTYAGSSISGYGLYSDNVYLNGRLRAGGGVARADDNGFAVEVLASAVYTDLNAYTLENPGGTTIGGLYGYDSTTVKSLLLQSQAANAGHTSSIAVNANNSMAGAVTAQLAATASDGSAFATLTKGQVYLQAVLGGASKAITLTHNAATIDGNTIWHAGNDGVGTGLNADLLDNLNSDYSGNNVVLRSDSTGILLLDNWMRVAVGKGIYANSSPYAAHFYSHANGWRLRSGNTALSWIEMQTGDGAVRGYLAADNSVAVGVLDSGGSWRVKASTTGVNLVGVVKFESAGEHRLAQATNSYLYASAVGGSRAKLGAWDEGGGGTAIALTLNETGGLVGVGCSDPQVELDVNGYSIRIRNNYTPASAGATGVKGQICYDSSYLYICTATNTWRRIAHATW